MKKIVWFVCLLGILVSCERESKHEKEISKIKVDLKVERFDKAFDEATPTDLPKLKQEYPFMFSKHISDSVWIARMKDTLQQQLFDEVDKVFENFEPIEDELASLFQHLKYYDKSFKMPKVVTTTSDVDYRNKVIVTDSIVLLALDTYLGGEHEFYEGLQRYISQNMKPSQILPDMAAQYAEHYIYQSKRRTLLDEMIYYGKQLYFKDIMLPFKSDAEKIGYTQEQLDWAIANESNVWSYFVEKELLYDTDSNLPSRFINPAPFTKFYLQLDSESPGRLGQYMGWQIVRAYMENNDISLMDMLKKDAEEIFNNAKYKPLK